MSRNCIIFGTRCLSDYPPILIEKVSNAALLLLAKQYKLAVGQHNPTCTGNFMRVYGIPCCHLIKAILDYSRFKFIELKDIDPHWHYERPTAEDLSYETGHDILLRIRDPEMTRQRRARQELNARRAADNTAREPSCLPYPVGMTSSSLLWLLELLAPPLASRQIKRRLANNATQPPFPRTFCKDGLANSQSLINQSISIPWEPNRWSSHYGKQFRWLPPMTDRS